MLRALLRGDVGLRRAARATSASTLAVALAVALAGCDEGVHFGDAIDLDPDFRVDDDGDLHTPYAVGANVRVFATGAERGGVALESSDPSVLEIVEREPASGDRVFASVHAAGTGVAELRLVDAHGDAIAGTEVEVRAPSRAVLQAAAPMFVDRDDLATVAATPAVLVDGTAWFEVHLYDGSTRLHGTGGLSVRADEELSLEVHSQFHDEAREWLKVSPLALGNHEVRLACAGETFATTVIAAVPGDAIGRVRLHGGEDDAAADGDWVPLAVQAYDADDQPIHGVTFAWELGGEVADVEGELWRYRVDREERRVLTVRYGEHEIAATIRAQQP